MSEKKKCTLDVCLSKVSTQDNVDRLTSAICFADGEVYECCRCNMVRPFMVEIYFEGYEHYMKKDMAKWEKCNKCRERICPECIETLDGKFNKDEDVLVCCDCSGKEI